MNSIDIAFFCLYGTLMSNTIHISPSFDPVLSQLHPFQIYTSCSSHIRFEILPSRPRSTTWSISMMSFDQNSVCISHFLYVYYMFCPSLFPQFDHTHSVRPRLQIMKMLLMCLNLPNSYVTWSVSSVFSYWSPCVHLDMRSTFQTWHYLRLLVPAADARRDEMHFTCFLFPDVRKLASNSVASNSESQEHMACVQQRPMPNRVI